MRQQIPFAAFCGSLALLTVALFAQAPAPTTQAALALTPPMGWNSWNAFRLDITDKIILAQAQAMVKTGMKSAGYEYVVIDGGWEGRHDAQGVFHSDPDRFPNMKKLCEDIHALGLKVGIHTSPGPLTCSHREASFGHETQDAQTFADWGIDFVKYDWCSADQVYKPDQMQAAYKKFADAIHATGRPMVYSLCQYGMQNVWRWGADVGGQMWRTTGNLGDNYFQMIAVGTGQNGLERFAGPGHWNDPDMLEVGNKGMDEAASRAQMTLWSILAAPLFAGNDLTKMTPETTAMLTNRELIAVDQDRDGIQGHRIWQEGPLQVWAKPLHDHSTALAVISIGSHPMTVTVDLKDLNLPDEVHVRDLWQDKDLGPIHKTLTVPLGRHGRRDAESHFQRVNSLTAHASAARNAIRLAVSPRRDALYVGWRGAGPPAMMVLLKDTFTTRRPRMAAVISGALARVRREGLEHLLPAQRFEQLCREQGHCWRRRVLTPQVTLRLFLIQVLHGNVAINALRQLSGLSFCAASYCQARVRLPLAALQALLAELTEAGLQWARVGGAGQARDPSSGSVYVVDSSTCSMPDTPPLRRRFDLPSPRRVGIAHPTSMIMGLLDLASGLFARAAAFSIFVADLKGVPRVHPALSAGDILVGDRAFCSFGHIALLNQRGVFCCFRLHQSRPSERIGQVCWIKGGHCPPWMSKRQAASLPEDLTLRIVRHAIEAKGYRTRLVLIATTLCDVAQWSDARVAELYRQRWEIETCWAHLKTTMKMDILKCKTTSGVLKELAAYLIVYNLVRLVMLRWAHTRGVPVRRVSFIDALRLLSVNALGLSGVQTLILNPDRTGRRQLRVRRRRPKHFPLLSRPRHRQPDVNPYRRPR